jgi:ubiquinone/menaquinone biosynthesis C-methylase UbiE/CheY-like chemotaxis protein
MEHLIKEVASFDHSFLDEKKAVKNLDPVVSSKPVVLAVTDDPSRLAALKSVMEPDYAVQTASGGREAIQLLKNLGSIDALLVDQSVTGNGGALLFRYVNEMVEKPEQIVKILISEPGAPETELGDPFLGRIDYHYDRPFDPAKLKQLMGSLIAQKSREKRRIMRAAINGDYDIEVDMGGHGKASVENLSESGMFVRTILPKNYILPFKIFLPEGPPLLATGRVVRVDEEIGGVGVKFLLIEDDGRRALVRFLSDQYMKSSLSELKEKYPFLRVDKIVDFTDKAKIVELIAEALRSQTEITAIHSRQKTHATLRLEAVEPWHFCRLAGEDLDTKFKTSDSLFISFQIGYATYTFETIVYRISDDGRSLECLYPRILFYSEKRSFKRAESDGRLDVEISLPDPFGATIRGTITDISEGGVSFVTEARNIALLIGTPLDSIRIFHKAKLIREVRGEIRNIFKIDGEGTGRLRYGVQFGMGRLTINTSEMPKFDAQTEKPKTKDTEKFRTGPRRQSDLGALAKRPPQVIHLENKKGEEITGLLNFSLPLDQDPIPVVIVPPAFGKTKETLFALAQTIVENFYTRGKPIAVIRYDGIRRKGESYRDPEASFPPYEMINSTFTQGAEDIKAVLDWLELNPLLKASAVILISFSLSALDARLLLRDDAYRRRIGYWISCMGTPEFRHLMTRINCGLDFLEQYQLGIKLGVMPVLGNLVNVDAYVADGVANAVATLDQAREDMRHIDIPVTWIFGEHDHWIKAEFIRDIMSIQADAPRDVIPVPIGHNARTSEDALRLFGTITSLIHRFLYKDMIMPVLPNKKDMEVMRRVEKDRIPPRKIKNRQDYWQRYLVGEDRLIGFDVMALSDDYQQLMQDQLLALDLKPADRFLDLGGGTGNFIEHLLKNGLPLPGHITIADLVPEGIAKAVGKLRPLFGKAGPKVLFDSLAGDVEMNRYLPVRRFLRGEVAGFKELVDRIENLTFQTAARIEELYSARLHRILRGEAITPQHMEWLKRTFDLPEIRTILDFNLAARFVQGLERMTPAYRQLVFSDDLEKNLYLPIKAGHYNKILMSLVLSYIFNPVETLLEIRRMIAPGGRLVLSSMRPDADASGLFTRLVDKIEATPAEDLPPERPKQILLESIRSFLNDAQALVEMEEAGTFDFFDPEKLGGLMEEAGWETLQTIPSFGDPPQGYIVVAKVREIHG